MTGLRKRGEEIRLFILKNLEAHSSDVVKITSKKFNITASAVNKHILYLEKNGALTSKGNTRSTIYNLVTNDYNFQFSLSIKLEENAVWKNYILPHVKNLPDNQRNIWQYGITEMVNNVIDHSEAQNLLLTVKKSIFNTQIIIEDDGIGIFNKIQKLLSLETPLMAIIELSKGKLTTDPNNHSGEGIFFTSKIFDRFSLCSGNVCFNHDLESEKYNIEETDSDIKGTKVSLFLSYKNKLTLAKVFDKYTAGEDFSFSKTVIQIRLSLYDGEALISRSQAKRILNRVDEFKIVIFDFKDVDFIGQAFADEIFRVFKNKHPQVDIKYENTRKRVLQMITRVTS